MKHNYSSSLRRTLSVLMLLLVSTYGYGFEVDGIYYCLQYDYNTPWGGNRYTYAEVISNQHGKYSGDIVIPSTVDYEGKTYNVMSIGWGAFERCTSLTSVSIPESVTSIGGRAFSGCISLTSVDIPQGCKIQQEAFKYCTSLTSISIPGGVTGIGDNAFQGCTSVTTIDLPSSIGYIGFEAFVGCVSVTTFICRAEKAPTSGPGFGWESPEEATLYVPASAIGDYKGSDMWPIQFRSILPLEDYETGIDTPTALQPDDATATAAPYYTLGGQRVNAPVRGHIYIRSGRKVIY